jgi:hypothetical protein
MVTIANLPGIAITIAVAAVGLTLVIRARFVSPFQMLKKPWSCNLCMSSWCSAFTLALLSAAYCLSRRPFTARAVVEGVVVLGIASAAAIPLATLALRIFEVEGKDERTTSNETDNDRTDRERRRV